MPDAKTAKIRAFLKRQHGELLRVKRNAIKKAVVPVGLAAADLTKRLTHWTDENGKLQPANYAASLQWAQHQTLALGTSVKTGLQVGGRAANELAAKHVAQFGRQIPPLFGDDEINFDEDETPVKDDRQRWELLALAFLGGKQGVTARTTRLTMAVLAGWSLTELADSLAARNDKPKAIAEAVMSPIESRAEMYVRTELGRVYSQRLGAIAAAREDLKKRWATIDPGCIAICRTTDGQIRAMDDDFDMGDGTTTDYPPAHPNCDCTWLPWKEAWGEMRSLDEYDDLEEAA